MYNDKMNKIKIITVLIFLLLIFKIDAQNLKFGWNIGNFYMGYDFLNDKGDDYDSIIGMEILQFNWIINKFSIGFNLLDSHYVTYESNHYSILPVKIAFVPLNFNDFLFLSVYGKASWDLIKNDDYMSSGFYGSFGIQISIFPLHNIFGLYYTPYFSIFSEYDSHKRYKIGFSLDISAIILFALYGVSQRER
jgi:hypothetical protein